MYSSAPLRVRSLALLFAVVIGVIGSGFAVAEGAPLDGVTATRAAAYSLRQLDSAYTGPAVNVREGSGNTTSDIGFTASGDLDTNALTAFCGMNSCFVTTWYDQSGNEKNATQMDPNMQPRIVSNGVIDMSGGHPALVFMANQTFGADWGSGYTSYGHSAVYSRDSTTYPFGSVYHQGPGWNQGWIHAMENNGPFNIGINGESFGYTSGPGNAGRNGLNSADSVAIGTIGVYTMNAPVGTIALYLNNILQVSATRTGVLPVVDNVRIGSWEDTETRYVHFHLSEMVFYSSSMTNTERSLFTIDEKRYYGLDVTAPVLALNGTSPQIVIQGSGVTSTGLVEHIVANAFQLGGVAQGWHADDTSWAYVLPFDFTYYGVTYASGQTIRVSSNGFICLDGAQSCSSTSGTIGTAGYGPFIAALWRDLYTENETDGGIVGNDIYLTTDPDFFTFRWQVTDCCGTTDPMNFSVTIFKNGQIRFDYGNQSAPYDSDYSTVGLGKGDGIDYTASIYNKGINFNQVASSLWSDAPVYADPGATWTDAVDGSGIILLATSGTVDINTIGTYILTYAYTDVAGNIGSITRTVQVVSSDVTAPVVTLVGSGTVTLANGAVYTESGATWSDNVDGTGAIALASSGSVNTATAGTYTLTYTKVDAAGNTGSTTRTVTVLAPVVSTGGGGGSSSSSSVAPMATQSGSTTTPVVSVPSTSTNPAITQDHFDKKPADLKKSKVITTTTTLKKGTQLIVYRVLPTGKKIKVGTVRVINGKITYTAKMPGVYVFIQK